MSEVGHEHDPGPRPGPSKGQRYYLYDNELSRPKFQPRNFNRSGRLPFSSHEYCGTYPTKPEDDSNRFFIPPPPPPRVPRTTSSRYYTRPEDVYHGRGRSRDRDRDEYRSGRVSRRNSSERRSSHDHERHYSSRSRYYEESKQRVRRIQDEYEHYHRHRRRSGSSIESSRRRTRSRSSSRSPHHHSRRRGRSDEGTRKRTPEPEAPPDETDTKVELHPLMHYIEDKPRLLKEAMSILRGKKLEALIPPELKHFSLSRLQQMCLEEINSVSLATLANVIDGKIINADATVQRKTSKKGGAKQAEGEASVPLKKIKKKLKKSISQDNAATPKKKKKRKHEETAPVLIVKKSKSSKAKLKAKEKKSKDKAKKKKKKAKEAPPSAPDVPGMPPQKTLMELLELEYRAKAIKALLKNQGLDTNRLDDALSMDTSPGPSTSVDVPLISPAAEVLETVQTTIPESCPDLLPSTSPTTVSTPPISAVSPDSTVTVVLEAADLTPVSKPQSPSQVSSSLAKEDSGPSCDEVEEEESQEQEKEIPPPPPPPVIDEELDYEDYGEELIIQPPTPIPVEIEEGEIASGDESEPETEEPEPEQTGFGTFGKEQEKGKYVYSSDSDSDENEAGGWRVLDSGDERSVKRRKWVKDPGPEAVYVRDSLDLEQLSDISNQELPVLEPDKEKEQETAKKGNQNNLDSESDTDAYLYQPRSPSPVDADGNRIPRPSDDENSDDSSGKPDQNIVIPGETHTCAERPADHQDQSSSQETESDEDTPRTWFNRWYNSKKVQKTVKSNKMLGRLRSKLRREKLIPDVPAPSSKPEMENMDDIPIIGSIQEYEKLYASGKYKPEPVKEPEPPVEEPEVESESGSDDEALWGDIMGTSNKS